MSCYLVQETDGSSRFTLEDGSGFLVLEDCIPTGGDAVMGGTLSDAAAQHQAFLRRRRIEQDDEDFGFLLSEI